MSSVREPAIDVQARTMVSSSERQPGAASAGAATGASAGEDRTQAAGPEGGAAGVERMPPKGARLTATEVATLRAWIDQGAKWGTVGAVVEGPAKSDHWAFQPICPATKTWVPRAATPLT